MQQDWHQEAIKLSGVGLSHREISEQLRIPKSTIGDYLRKVKSSEDKAATEIVSIDTDHSKQGPRILVIPDTQCKPGISFDYLSWIGEYAAAKMPDVIVHLGDHADLPSLSSYDKGKKGAEGRRVSLDIQAAIEGMNALLGPIKAQQSLYPEWKPRLVKLAGNHLNRIDRHVEANPELEGFLSYKDLRYEEMGWEFQQFLVPIIIGGISFVHYTTNPFTGKPLGGTALNILKQYGMSVVQGHKQTLDVATRTLHNGQRQWSIVAGAAYIHNESYRDYTSNKHWRGIIMLNDVQNGSFDPTFVSMDYLKRRYSNEVF